jgi:hypothetical protein
LQRFILLYSTRNDAAGRSTMLMAVSNSKDATGSWSLFGFNARLDGSTPTTNWCDYPSRYEQQPRDARRIAGAISSALAAAAALYAVPKIGSALHGRERAISADCGLILAGVILSSRRSGVHAPPQPSSFQRCAPGIAAAR